MRRDGESAVEWEQFEQVVAAAVRRERDDLWDRDRPLGEAGLDDIELYLVVTAAEDVNPFFRVPDQLAITDLSLKDVFHFVSVMTSRHAVAEREQELR